LFLDEDRYLWLMHVFLAQALTDVLFQLDGSTVRREQWADERQGNRATQGDPGTKLRQLFNVQDGDLDGVTWPERQVGVGGLLCHLTEEPLVERRGPTSRRDHLASGRHPPLA
jgi:hypothetical protein